MLDMKVESKSGHETRATRPLFLGFELPEHLEEHHA
jgi:hypothetical protein